MKRLFGITGLLILILGIVSCQGMRVKTKNDKDLVYQRVSDYVDAKNARDVKKEYSFFSPSYKNSVTLEQFIKRHNVSDIHMALKHIDYEPGAEKARVELIINLAYMGFEFKDVEFSQNWIRVDGQWYLDAKDTTFRDLFTPPGRSKEKAHEKK